MTGTLPAPFPTLKDLPLEALRLDGGTQPRVRIDWDVVKEYAERMRAGDRFKPVTVFFDGTDYWVSDGFHRVHAARKAEQGTFQSEVWEGPLEEAVWDSLGANKGHGLRRTNEDKVRSVKQALHKKPHLSDSAIAEHVGVSHTMVAKYRLELRTTCNGCKSTPLAGPKTATRTGRDGRTIDTANIGKPRRPKTYFDDDPPDADDVPVDLEGDAPDAAAESETVTDRVGQPVEGKVAEAFRRRHEVQALMLALSKVKTTVLKAIEAKDMLFADVNPSRFEAECNNAYHQLKAALPYAACPYCRAAGCKACHGRGWIGEAAYDRAPRELKQ